ncbi:MAG: hypothetical protein ACUVX1_16250 [Chloroflexota bacterium]
MTTILLANVGVRDVQLDGELLQSPRDDGQRLLGEWPDIERRLSLPIIEPLIAFVRDRWGWPAAVVLFATDQPPSAPAQHRAKDTIHCAELAKRLLNHRCGPLQGRVFVRATRDENPALYDEALGYFKKTFQSGARPFGEATEAIVSPVGGTPAMNTGLLLAAAERFGLSCRAIYLAEGAARPVDMNLGRALYESRLRRLVCGHLANHHYAAAKGIMVELGLEETTAAVALTEYALRRLNFDFDGAVAALDRAYAEASPAQRRLMERLSDEARRLGAGDQRLLLLELPRSMEVVFRQGAYLDYLARLVRFAENLARYLVETHLPPLRFEADDPRARSQREEMFQVYPDLLDYVGQLQVSGQPLRYTHSNTVTLLALVDYILADRPGKPAHWRLGEERRGQVAEMAGFLRSVQKLIQKRNETMHRFGGASAETILGLYRQAAGEDRVLEDDLGRVVRSLLGGEDYGWGVDAARDAIAGELNAL